MLPRVRPNYAFLLAILLLAFAGCSLGQTLGSAELDGAYKATAAREYDQAIALFRKGLAFQAANLRAHKDLAYTLLRTGETAEARDEFAVAMRLNAADETAALEFAFLAFETQKPIEARRTFDRLRHSHNPQTRATAEQAFQNIDKPLADGIARWKLALQRSTNPESLAMYSAHEELGHLAELRDELPLAAEQYELCRKLKPNLSELLLTVARIWQGLGRAEDAHAALLVASRSADSRTAEQGLEQMGTRYPYPYEFVNALKLDEKNKILRKELGYLYLAMGKTDEAKAEFKSVLDLDSKDQAAIDQLSELNGFHRRNPAPVAAAIIPAPASTVAPVPVPQQAQVKVDPRVIGIKSLKLGYSRDAIKYLRQAHENNPDDDEVMMDLGYAYNLAKDDADAIPWFDRARHSEDSLIAAESNKAYHNLRGDLGAQTTVWMLPMYSLRWHDAFSYGQIKRTIPLPFAPFNHLLSFYLSTRFMGDVKSSLQDTHTITAPQYLSESSFIVGAGISTKTWHHLTGWVEAGEAVNYLPFRHDIGTAIPDYRGGLNFARSFGPNLSSKRSGWFYDTTADAVYVNRFDKDWLFYSQHRMGRTLYGGDGFSLQTFFNVNYTRDEKSQYWANTVEMGPGFRLHLPFMPPSVYFATDLLRGVYTNNIGNPRRPNYNDVRVSMWYAFTK